MGYRSDVRMVIRGPKDLILREFANLRLIGNKCTQEVLDEWHVMECDAIKYRSDPSNDTVQEIPAAVAILGQGGTEWKWYKGYEDVRAHNAVYNHFQWLHSDSEDDSAESFLDGAFVRIGKENNDIEFDHFGEGGYELAGPARSIVCPYDDISKPDLRPRLTGIYPLYSKQGA